MSNNSNHYEIPKPEQTPEYYKNRTYFPTEHTISLILETAYPDKQDQSVIISYLSPEMCYTNTLSYDDPSNPIHRSTLHKHEYFELLYVIRGHMYQKIENRRHLYPTGSLCLLNRNIHHAEEFSSYFQCAFLALPQILINEILFPSEPFFFSGEDFIQGSLLELFVKNNAQNNRISSLEYVDFIPAPSTENPHMYDCFEKLIHTFTQPKIGSTFQLKCILLEIFFDLLNDKLYQTRQINIGSDFEAEIFDKITVHMTSTNGRISRSELAEKTNYDGNYLNRIVKKYTGLSIFGYGTSICMKEACQLLMETDLTVSQISEQLGFTNRTHFYSLFEKQYGMTPAEYRKHS